MPHDEVLWRCPTIEVCYSLNAQYNQSYVEIKLHVKLSKATGKATAVIVSHLLIQTVDDTHTHTHSILTAIFPGKAGLAGCPLFSFSIYSWTAPPFGQA